MQSACFVGTAPSHAMAVQVQATLQADNADRRTAEAGMPPHPHGRDRSQRLAGTRAERASVPPVLPSPVQQANWKAVQGAAHRLAQIAFPPGARHSPHQRHIRVRWTHVLNMVQGEHDPAGHDGVEVGLSLLVRTVKIREHTR